MDHNEIGLSPVRTTRHAVSIPTVLVAELHTVALNLRERAARIEDYFGAQTVTDLLVQGLRQDAARILAIAESANH